MSAEAIPNDVELLALLRKRDQATIECLVRTHTAALLGAARGLGFDAESAGELVQRTWCSFVEAAPHFEGRSKVRTFLFGILYNRARELRRQNFRADRPDPIDAFMEERFSADGHYAQMPSNPEQFAHATETMGFIQECLEGLPVAQRMAFWLREVEEVDTPEICSTLDVTETDVGVLLFRARNRLRECLEGKIER